jgi:hypothetical protein
VRIQPSSVEPVVEEIQSNHGLVPIPPTRVAGTCPLL